MSQSSNFFRLQSIDSQLDQIQARILEIESNLEENEEIQLAKEKHDRAQDVVDAERKKLRKAEETVRDQRVKIEQTESMLYGGKVKNPKELQDLQNDVASLKRYLGVLEDKELEVMLALEVIESELQQATEALEKTSAKVIEHQAGLRSELSGLIVLKERLKIERHASASVIPSNEYSLYEQLRSQRRGLAVAKVVDKSCNACGSTLPPALIQSAHSSTQLIRCPSCGRILYPG